MWARTDWQSFIHPSSCGKFSTQASAAVHSSTAADWLHCALAADNVVECSHMGHNPRIKGHCFGS